MYSDDTTLWCRNILAEPIRTYDIEDIFGDVDSFYEKCKSKTPDSKNITKAVLDTLYDDGDYNTMYNLLIDAIEFYVPMETEEKIILDSPSRFY